LLNTTNLIEQKALEILDTYEGGNNYLLSLKTKKTNNPKFYPTRSQSEYIINFHQVQPKVAKKWVDLDSYFAKKLADDKLYTQIPEKVYIEKLLVEKDTSYHIWGKIFSGETLHDIWLPKTAIIKNQENEIKEVDYSKYSHRPPLNHQKEAIEKLLKNNRFILADDMGLGKTTSVVISALETEVKKILVICPASLKINWMREFQLYTNREIFICEGKKYSTESDIVIMNYDIVKNFYDTKSPETSPIIQSNFDLIVIDEAHYISNTTAIRTKLINSFAKKSKRLWLLSGTPMTSRPINYFNLLSLIDSPVAQNWMAYVIRYCEGYQFRVGGNKKVWNTNGASNLEELRDRTSRQVLRRLKTEVLDLPEKIINPVYLRLKSREYEDLMGDYYNWYESKDDSTRSLTVQFTKIMKVRQVIANEKVESTIELAENILEQGKKVIIFTNFTEVLQRIHSHFGKKSVYLDGSCSKSSRQHSIDEFQNNDKIKIFVGNLKAAGAGITLTASEVVIMNDLSFVPSDHAQAEDRAYRYGQKNNVLVYYPIFENTIEGIVYDILSHKKNIIDVVMGDTVDKTDVVQEIMSRINSRR
jgi:SWI/SNF-related matrix-associated actin-dependent regulator 1 of chromatin subfamily A